MATPTEVYAKTNQAIDTLSNLWQSMLNIIQAVSASSAASLTAEPDLAALQAARKEYEQLVATLKTQTTWLDENKLVDKSQHNEEEEESNRELLKEQEQLKQEAARVSDQLKRMISQSYALQFQIEMFLSSSQQITPC